MSRRVDTWIAYIGIYLAVLVLVGYAGVLSMSEIDRTSVGSAPLLSLDELRAGVTEIQKAAEAPVGDPEQYFILLNRIEALQASIGKHDTSAFSEEGPEYGRLYGASRFYLGQIQNAYIDRYQSLGLAAASSAYYKKHPEQRMKDWRIETVGLGNLWAQVYLWTLPLIGMFFLIRLRENGYKLWIEFVTWLKPVFATLAWPITIFRYPNGDAAQQIVYAARYTAYVLGAALSFSAGGNVARASEKASGPDKKQQGYSLQIDGYHSELVGDGGPDPEEILRLNFGTPSGFYVEGLRINDRGSRVDIVTAGAQVAKTTHGVVNAYAGQKMVIEKPEGLRTVLAGIQTFLSKGKFSFVLPVAQLERQVKPGPKTSLSVLGQVTVRFAKKLYGGLEFWGKVSDDHSSGYYAGPVLGFSPTPALIMEAGCFRNDGEETRCRARMMHTIRW